MLGPVTAHRAIGGPSPLSVPGSRPLQAFLPPGPLHPFVVHPPAIPPQKQVGHAPNPPDVLNCDLPEAMAEVCLLNVEDLAGMALGAAVLPHHPAEKAFRSPVTLLENLDGFPAAFLAQTFPSAKSLSIAFSSSASARSFLSRALSLASWVSHLAPSAYIPPYCCRQQR